MTRDYSLGEIAAYLKAELRGDPEVRITGLNTLQDSVEGQLSFLSNTKYSKYLSGSQASAVILSEKNADGYAHDCLVVVDPYLAYALIHHGLIAQSLGIRSFIPVQSWMLPLRWLIMCMLGLML